LQGYETAMKQHKVKFQNQLTTQWKNTEDCTAKTSVACPTKSEGTVPGILHVRHKPADDPVSLVSFTG